MPIVNCEKCKKEFYAKPSWLKIGWGKYCSPKCHHEGLKRGKFIACFICGKKTWKAPKQISHSKSGKFFCSKSCQTLWRNKEFRGVRHHNWKGGENILHKSLLIENHVKPVCKLCSCKDERVLAVHHLDKNRKNNNVKNLIFLCQNCHHLVHCHNEKI
ncbi:MAG: hypothetical protein UR98_C0009G0015 [Parcubacteria group bacterium GW2011_GWA1_36_12]|nr:MAG: hypothetical protein UR98_C0009G0015 [Parcubacteria group bacterium GW2011_GWA1_36_12]